jgi:lipopolysaccharide biosynthesis glycosyltransferase
MRNAIFVAFDDMHWHYAMNCFNSIRDNYPFHPDILVYYNGFRKERIAWLKGQAWLKLFLNPELPKDLIAYKYHKDVVSDMVYYKYLLWTEQFDNYDNILHLDVDTIILSSLNELFEKTDFFVVKNNLYFKELQVLDTNKDNRAILKLRLSNVGLNFPQQGDMINAGVFLIPKKYRTPEYYNTLLNITRVFLPYLKYADQSALSLWCMLHNIKPSEDYSYNFQMPLFNKFLVPRYKSTGSIFSFKKDILNSIRIIHYSGSIKPDREKFMKWGLMGRYSKLFRDCYRRYMGVLK